MSGDNGGYLVAPDPDYKWLVVSRDDHVLSAWLVLEIHTDERTDGSVGRVRPMLHAGRFLGLCIDGRGAVGPSNGIPMWMPFSEENAYRWFGSEQQVRAYLSEELEA
jgi:hypothetical protein